MIRLIGTGLASGLLVGCVGTLEPTGLSSGHDEPKPAPSETTITNFVSTLALEVWIECANGGVGELVFFEGRLHTTVHTTLTAKGNTQIKLHFQPQGVKGTGMTSGMTWVGNGVTLEVATTRLATQGATNTFVNNFRLIGPGPDNNLVLHHVRHFTINADGTVTALHEDLKAECK